VDRALRASGDERSRLETRLIPALGATVLNEQKQNAQLSAFRYIERYLLERKSNEIVRRLYRQWLEFFSFRDLGSDALKRRIKQSVEKEADLRSFRSSIDLNHQSSNGVFIKSGPDQGFEKLRTLDPEMYSLVFNPQNAKELFRFLTDLRQIYYRPAFQRTDIFSPLTSVIEQGLYFPVIEGSAGGLYVTPVTESFRRHVLFRMNSERRVVYAIEIKMPGDWPERQSIKVRSFDLASKLYEEYPRAIVKPIAFVTYPDSSYRIYGQDIAFPAKGLPFKFSIAIFEYLDNTGVFDRRNYDAKRIDRLTVDDFKRIADHYPSIYEKGDWKRVAKDALKLAHMMFLAAYTLGRSGVIAKGSTDMHFGNLRLVLGPDKPSVANVGDLDTFLKFSTNPKKRRDQKLRLAQNLRWAANSHFVETLSRGRSPEDSFTKEDVNGVFEEIITELGEKKKAREDAARLAFQMGDSSSALRRTQNDGFNGGARMASHKVFPVKRFDFDNVSQSKSDQLIHTMIEINNDSGRDLSGLNEDILHEINRYPEGFVFVASDSSRPIGYLWAQTSQRNKSKYMFYVMAVRNAYHHMKVASQLVRKVVRYVRKKGGQSIWLSPMTLDNIPVMEFWDKQATQMRLKFDDVFLEIEEISTGEFRHFTSQGEPSLKDFVDAKKKEVNGETPAKNPDGFVEAILNFSSEEGQTLPAGARLAGIGRAILRLLLGHPHIWINRHPKQTHPDLALEDFRKAQEVVSHYTKASPLVYAKRLSGSLHKTVVINDESRQVAGSFKSYGVYYQVYKAIEGVVVPAYNKDQKALEILKKGEGLEIMTQTDGNHGIAMIHAVTAAVSYFRNLYGNAVIDNEGTKLDEYIRRIKPVVYTIDKLAPEKREPMETAMKEYSRVHNMPERKIQTYDSYEDARKHRESYQEEKKKRGEYVFYMDHGGRDIMLGHGVAGLEIAEKLKAAGIGDDKKVAILVPVGAGGPIGIGAALKAVRPNTTAIMVQSHPYNAFVRTLKHPFRSFVNWWHNKIVLQKNEKHPAPSVTIRTSSGDDVELVFPDGIAVDAPENEWTVQVAREFLDAAVSVDEGENGAWKSGAIVFHDLKDVYTEKGLNPEKTRVGGTTAILAEALKVADQIPALRDANVIVLLATEGNVPALVTDYYSHLLPPQVQQMVDQFSQEPGAARLAQTKLTSPSKPARLILNLANIKKARLLDGMSFMAYYASLWLLLAGFWPQALVLLVTSVTVARTLHFFESSLAAWIKKQPVVLAGDFSYSEVIQVARYLAEVHIIDFITLPDEAELESELDNPTSYVLRFETREGLIHADILKSATAAGRLATPSTYIRRVLGHISATWVALTGIPLGKYFRKHKYWGQAKEEVWRRYLMAHNAPSSRGFLVAIDGYLEAVGKTRFGKELEAYVVSKLKENAINQNVVLIELDESSDAKALTLEALNQDSFVIVSGANSIDHSTHPSYGMMANYRFVPMSYLDLPYDRIDVGVYVTSSVLAQFLYHISRTIARQFDGVMKLTASKSQRSFSDWMWLLIKWGELVVFPLLSMPYFLFNGVLRAITNRVDAVVRFNRWSKDTNLPHIILRNDFLGRYITALDSTGARLAVSASLIAVMDFDNPIGNVVALIEYAKLAQLAGADRLHYVVIQGVPSAIVTAPSARETFEVFSALNLERLRKAGVRIPIDVHLEVMKPDESFILPYIQAGASRVQLHWESFVNQDKHEPEVLLSRLQFIKSNGAEAGVALTLGGDIEGLVEFVQAHPDAVDHVLLQAVEAGAAGQAFDKHVLAYISRLRESGFKKDIYVDGGIKQETASLARAAGATVLVAGSAFFGKGEEHHSIAQLHEALYRLGGRPAGVRFAAKTPDNVAPQNSLPKALGNIRAQFEKSVIVVYRTGGAAAIRIGSVPELVSPRLKAEDVRFDLYDFNGEDFILIAEFRETDPSKDKLFVTAIPKKAWPIHDQIHSIIPSRPWVIIKDGTLRVEGSMLIATDQSGQLLKLDLRTRTEPQQSARLAVANYMLKGLELEITVSKKVLPSNALDNTDVSIKIRDNPNPVSFTTRRPLVEEPFVVAGWVGEMLRGSQELEENTKVIDLDRLENINNVIQNIPTLPLVKEFLQYVSDGIKEILGPRREIAADDRDRLSRAKVYLMDAINALRLLNTESAYRQIGLTIEELDRVKGEYATWEGLSVPFLKNILRQLHIYLNLVLEGSSQNLGVSNRTVLALEMDFDELISHDSLNYEEFASVKTALQAVAENDFRDIVNKIEQSRYDAAEVRNAAQALVSKMYEIFPDIPSSTIGHFHIILGRLRVLSNLGIIQALPEISAARLVAARSAAEIRRRFDGGSRLASQAGLIAAFFTIPFPLVLVTIGLVWQGHWGYATIPGVAAGISALVIGVKSEDKAGNQGARLARSVIASERSERSNLLDGRSPRASHGSALAMTRRVSTAVNQKHILIAVGSEGTRLAVQQLLGRNTIAQVIVTRARKPESNVRIVQNVARRRGIPLSRTLYYDARDLNAQARLQIIDFVNQLEFKLQNDFRRLLDGEIELEDIKDNQKKEQIIDQIFSLLPIIRPKTLAEAGRRSAPDIHAAIKELRLQAHHPSFGYTFTDQAVTAGEETLAPVWTLKTVLKDRLFLDTLTDRDERSRRAFEDYLVVTHDEMNHLEELVISALGQEGYERLKQRFGDPSEENSRIYATDNVFVDSIYQEIKSHFNKQYKATQVLFVDSRAENGAHCLQRRAQSAVKLLLHEGRYTMLLDKVVAEILARRGRIDGIFINKLFQDQDGNLIYQALVPIDYAQALKAYYKTRSELEHAA